MSKRARLHQAPPPASASAPASASKAREHALPSAAAVRETIESVVIAFILAFLLRTYEAEAYMIPTGSMAPTLMGRHKDLICPRCGYAYQVGASEEVDSRSEASKGREYEITRCTCPMCRYTTNLDSDNSQRKSYPSYRGDRVMVDRVSHDFRDLKRWDIVVFKCPREPETPYVKRLIGLPGETIRIRHGDIWVRSGDDQSFRIARKPPEKLLAMLQPVFDNDLMPKIAKDGWPARWSSQPVADGGAQDAWQSSDFTTFSNDGKTPGECWLRYRHLVPTHRQWAEWEASGSAPATAVRPKLTTAVRPQLITDFTAYDTGRTRRDANYQATPPESMSGLHWVGDLALKCRVESQSETGDVVVELRKGGRRFQSRIDLSTGQATLSISGEGMAKFRPTAMTNVRGTGSHEVIFANCDNELRLWVDGRLAAFDVPTTYEDLGNAQPDQSDRMPAGVASVGAALRVSHLRLLRDVYYIATRSANECLNDYAEPWFVSDDISDQLIQRHPRQQSVDFPLSADRFFMLGDNSAGSFDGRLWGPVYWVDRNLLIGRAICVYWPHSWNAIRTPWVDIPFPWFPNFGRMRMTR